MSQHEKEGVFTNGNGTTKPRNIVIFGGAGFIGSNWAERLLSTTSHRVHIVDKLSRTGAEWNLRCLKESFGSSRRLRTTIGDIRDFGLVKQAAAEADEIYHFAAQVAVTTSITDPRDDFEINAHGTFNILEAARTSGRRPFVLFTSTNKVYGALRSRPVLAERGRYRFRRGSGVTEEQPLDFYSPYGCSKGAADQYVHDYARVYSIPTVVLRMSCIAGPRQFGTEDQGWVAHFLYSALQGSPITIYGDGCQTRDVLNVADLLHAFELLLQNVSVTAGNVYNIGGGEGNAISLLELVEQIEHLLGTTVPHSFGPTRPGDQLVYITDFGKLTLHTAWTPTRSVQRTLHDILNWYESNRPLSLPAVPLHHISSSAEPLKAA